VARALGRDIKGKLSPLIYLLAIALAFGPLDLVTLYVLVAVLWLVPDRVSRLRWARSTRRR